MRRILLLVLALAWLPMLAVAVPEQCIFCKGDTLLKVLRYSDGPKPVCQNCIKKYPVCSLCGLPTNLPQHRDQRYFCPSCKSAGVFTEAAAKPLQQQVLAFLQSQLGATGLPPIRMCDKDELQTRFIEGGRALNVAGFYNPYNPEMIYLLTGTSALVLQGTMAHEYTHAWQSRNCGPQDRALTEGFACLMEYRFYMSKGERQRAEHLKTHSDPDYGKSLVRMLEIEQKKPGKALIDWVKKAKNLDSP